MSRIAIAIVALAAVVSLPDAALAVCRCACVAGHDRNLCDHSFDVPATCGFHACQVPPVGGPPIGDVIGRPPGTRGCRLEQVSRGAGYSWERVCR